MYEMLEISMTKLHSHISLLFDISRKKVISLHLYFVFEVTY